MRYFFLLIFKFPEYFSYFLTPVITRLHNSNTYSLFSNGGNIDLGLRMRGKCPLSHMFTLGNIQEVKQNIHML